MTSRGGDKQRDRENRVRARRRPAVALDSLRDGAGSEKHGPRMNRLTYKSQSEYLGRIVISILSQNASVPQAILKGLGSWASIRRISTFDGGWGESCSSSDVLIIIEPNLEKKGFLTLIPQIFSGLSERIQLVVCTTPGDSNLRILSRLPPVHVVLIGVDSPRRVEEIVRSAAEEAEFRIIRHEMEKAVRTPPVLRKAISRVLYQRPLPSAEALEVLSSGGIAFIRTVKDLSTLMSCEAGYLSKAAKEQRIRLGRFIRWTTFLWGMRLRSSTTTPWSQISLRLGFSSIQAFSNFSKRLVHLSPMKAEKVPMGTWAETCLREVFTWSGKNGRG